MADLLPSVAAPAQLLPVQFGMDPLFGAPVRVLGAHVLQMPAAGPAGVFLLYGRPVQSVEVCGFLSALDERDDAVTMSLDDGSGVPVEVTVWRRGFDGSARLVRSATSCAPRAASAKRTGEGRAGL